jgi:hypothetical protein
MGTQASMPQRIANFCERGRDKSVTPHYVSELGGEEPLAFKDGIPVDDGEDDDEDEDPDEDAEEDDEDDEEELHPPTGGAKTPLKRGESSGRGNGKKALKKQRKSAVQKAVESMEERQHQMEKKRMSYTIQRDNADRLLRKRKNDQKHTREMRKLDVEFKKYELQTLLLKQKLGFKFDGSQDALPEDKEAETNAEQDSESDEDSDTEKFKVQINLDD